MANPLENINKAQEKTTEGTKSQEKQIEKQGNVEIEKVKDEKGTEIGTIVKNYNERGLLSKETRMDNEAKILSERIIEYNSCNLISKQIHKEGKSTAIDEWLYDNQNRLVKFENNLFYEGKKIGSTLTKIDRKKEYYESGRYAEIEKSVTKDYSRSNSPSSEEKFTTHKLYDKDGRIVQDYEFSEHKYRGGQTLSFLVDTKYENGNIKKTKHIVEENGQKISEQKTEYDYYGRQGEVYHEKWDFRTAKMERWIETPDRKKRQL